MSQSVMTNADCDVMCSDGLQMSLFLYQYRAYCEELLYYTLAARYDDVRASMQRFWSSSSRRSEDIMQVVSRSQFCDVIRLCDSCFMRTMASEYI